MSALATFDVRKRYRDGAAEAEAVGGVTLAIERGELCVLRGPSGSGKTTLLGLLGAMIAPTSGTVEVLGQDVTHLRDHHRATLRRERVGFVFQDLSLIGAMSLIDNVLLPIVPIGGARRAHRERADALLERVGLRDRAQSPARALSGGQRQRAAIVRALILAPPVLLLDEPTAHLDGDNAASIAALLRSLADEGTTIVAASHDPRLYEHEAIDRAIALRDGRLV